MWTVCQLADHVGFAMSMLSTLVSKEVPGGPEYDRFGFFRLPKAEVDPIVYQVAWDVTTGKSPAEILENCRTALRQSVREAGWVPAWHVGSAVVGLMRVDEFVPPESSKRSCTAWTWRRR